MTKITLMAEKSETRRNVVGWSYVAVQVVVLALLVVLPASNDWPTPFWVVWTGRIFSGAGLIIMGVAGLGLGSSLTPTPVPRKHSRLKTAGLYRFVRHPIYSGVLLTSAGLALSSSSWVHVCIATVAALFFNQKAKWEETQLCERYDDYQQYMHQTPRFIPRLWSA